MCFTDEDIVLSDNIFYMFVFQHFLDTVEDIVFYPENLPGM